MIQAKTAQTWLYGQRQTTQNIRNATKIDVTSSTWNHSAEIPIQICDPTRRAESGTTFNGAITVGCSVGKVATSFIVVAELGTTS